MHNTDCGSTYIVALGLVAEADDQVVLVVGEANLRVIVAEDGA